MISSQHRPTENLEDGDHGTSLKTSKVVLLLVGLGLVFIALSTARTRSENQLAELHSEITSRTSQGNSEISKVSVLEDHGHGACRATGWNHLSSTWNVPNPTQGFYPVPETEQAAAATANYKLLLKAHAPGSPGNVYSDGDDLSRLPFYNKRGQISGVIVGIAEAMVSDAMKKQSPWKKYRLGAGKGNFWGIEFHLRKPHKVGPCPVSQREAVGHGLWVADKNSPRFIEMPYEESSAKLTHMGFVQGGCVPTMGMHYWKDIQCDGYYPVFLMYTNGVLDAFGVIPPTNIGLNPSKYWETTTTTKDTPSFAPGINLPDCVVGVTGNSMHVFLKPFTQLLCSASARL